jgi:hypothetical protein
MVPVVLAAFSGAVIACVVAALALYAVFAAGGYTREALVELPPGSFAIVGGVGALVGLTVALFADRLSLPGWVRPVAMGSLAGVAVVAVSTLIVACVLGGSSSKLQALYLQAGLVYGVPAGLIAGAIVGWFAARRGTGS